MSQSCKTLQEGHCHYLTIKSNYLSLKPQLEKVLEEGSNSPILKMVFPNFSALYVNFSTKLLHAESPIACASL